MAMEDFFGYGSCDSKYDNRRHINVIFHEMASMAKGMRGINLTQEFMQQLFELTEKAMRIYRVNSALVPIESYALENISC